MQGRFMCDGRSSERVVCACIVKREREQSGGAFFFGCLESTHMLPTRRLCARLSPPIDAQPCTAPLYCSA